MYYYREQTETLYFIIFSNHFILINVKIELKTDISQKSQPETTVVGKNFLRRHEKETMGETRLHPQESILIRMTPDSVIIISLL